MKKFRRFIRSLDREESFFLGAMIALLSFNTCLLIVDFLMF